MQDKTGNGASAGEEEMKEDETGKEDKYWKKLETPSERRSRLRSLYTVHTGALVFALGFSIVITGILPYLRRLTGMKEHKLIEVFGWTVAINPLGQMVFSPVLGWLSNRLGGIRLVMLGTCCIYVLGFGLYSSLSLFPAEDEGQLRVVMMLLARLLVGIASANLAPCRAYIAGATFRHERNTQLSLLSLFQTVGFILGPAIQAALTPIGCTDGYLEGQLSLDMYTIPGWLGCGVGLLCTLLFLPCVFQESNVSAKEATYLAKQVGADNADILSTRPDLTAVAVCLFGFFVFMGNYILLEVIGVPLCQQQLGWAEDDSVRILGILMSIGAVISMLCYGSIGALTKRFDERLVYLALGILPMLLSRVAHIPMASYTPTMKPPTTNTTLGAGGAAFLGTRSNENCGSGGGSGGCSLDWCEYTPAMTEFQFYLGYVIATVGFPYCVGICQALFSKVVGPRPQGTWMGLLTATGSLARIIGPIFASYVYEKFGTYWTFGICCGSMVVVGLVTAAAYSRLVPIETRLAKKHKLSSHL